MTDTSMDQESAHHPRGRLPAEPPAHVDVLVIGAGIAGATAARLLARQGRSVVLVEREAFPRYKVCGSCLNLRSVTHLREAGILDSLRDHGAQTLHHLELGTGSKSATIPLPGGLSVTRALLDGELVRAAGDEGAIFCQKTAATLGPLLGERRLVYLDRGEARFEVSARIVLAADGLPGRVLTRTGESESSVSPRARIGLGAVSVEATAPIEPGRIYMACGAGGYAGIVRAEGGKLVIAAALDHAYIRQHRTPGDSVAALYAGTDLPAPSNLQELDWKGTPPLTRRSSRLASRRVLVLGDAGGYVEPFTGEGMAWAFASAYRAAQLLESAFERDWSVVSQAWERTERRAIRRQRLLCHTTAWLLRSPRATRTLVGILSSSATLSKPFTWLINSENRSS